MQKQLFALLLTMAFGVAECTLRQVAYISSTSSPEGMTQLEIEDILVKCRKYNMYNQITGVLVYHDVNVFQIIEGAPKTISKVFDRIHKDVRHRGIIVLQDRTIEHRAFPKWSMMFRDLAYTAQMEQWAEQESELSIFEEMTTMGNTNDVSGLDIASQRAMKLLKIYSKLVFHQPQTWSSIV